MAQLKVNSNTTSPWWFQHGSHVVQSSGSALALLFSTSDGPSPDAVSYGCLVQTCCRAQEMEKAQELVKEADSQGIRALEASLTDSCTA
jgi:pentatricopeptide repeat protein